MSLKNNWMNHGIRETVSFCGIAFEVQINSTIFNRLKKRNFTIYDRKRLRPIQLCLDNF